MTSTAEAPYGMILDEFAVVATDHTCENELGCAAFSTRSLLASRPEDTLRRERLDRRLDHLGAGGERSTFRDGPGTLLAHAPWFSAVAPALLLHEGYMVDPAAEGSAEIEKLRVELGDRFWAVSPELWNAWGSKGPFRRRCRDVLGDFSVPPGIELTAEGARDVLGHLNSFDARPPGRTVVKLPGGGGMGNLVLTPDTTESWPRRVDALWKEHDRLPKPADVVIEAWLPWQNTYSVSFLVTPARATTLLAVTEQLVDPIKAGWVGSRTGGPLGEADTAAVLDHLQGVVDAMTADGYVGVVALDIIVGPGAAWAGHGLALPSGQRMCVIECNPRFNQHNRTGMVVERLARRWDIDSRTLSWSLRCIEPSGSTTFPALLASLEKGAPEPVPAPTRDRPVRTVFAHRQDKALELTVFRAV